MNDKLFKPEEKALFSLRALYKTYGYLPFKMSKFESYDFYLQNKEFLISDRVITFNDTDGRLLALKPDVTLSIIKNGKDVPGCKQKVFYNENVYRVSPSTHHFREIMQTGLECIGDIDLYDLFEVVLLAAQSLSLISDDFVLQISHLGILSSLLDVEGANEVFRREALRFIAEKNLHDLKRICAEYQISEEGTSRLCSFIGIYGERKQVLDSLLEICTTNASKDALRTLSDLSDLLSETPYSDKIRFDFSIVNDMNYYGGIVFKGFLSGICEGVLSGGQYDILMSRMGRKAGAIGFALYLDLLEEQQASSDEYDVDILLLYEESVPYQVVLKEVSKMISNGLSVSAQKSVPPKLRYKKQIVLGKENAQ